MRARSIVNWGLGVRLVRWLVLAVVPLLAIEGLAARRAHAAEPIRLAMIEGMSGPFANAGEAVARNLGFAVARVNERGGVRLLGGARPLQLVAYDSKGQVEEALLQLKRAADDGVPFVLQGNSSAVAGALIDAVNRHNAREPAARQLFLNYSAVDPALTNERCSPWHFRFDAHAEMRMAALMEVIASDARVKRVYLINQDYSFGREVARSARVLLGARRPDVQIVGDELHPLGRIKDFSPYAAKIKAAGADTVITGNWGNDLTFLVRAARDAGLDAGFTTFYGNGLGAPAAIGEAGVGRVRAVAEWHPNGGVDAMERVYAEFRQRHPEPREDYFQARMVVLVEMLVRALEAAATTEAAAVASRLAGMRYTAAQGNPLGEVWMRPEDHQLQAALVVSVMDRLGTAGVARDIEGSGYGFRTERVILAEHASRPHSCKMPRPTP
ncbi:MAG: branched-chain amino acid ABC transporter substrate-binding protein [Burkholderiales bacterium]|nr:branched-chain amino acid ABC transporter substrate-binding protein [Burkholderiales bacterium]